MLDDAFSGVGDLFGATPAATAASSSVPAALQRAGTASLLREVGGALAAASAVAASGVLSVRGIGGADANLAALPLRVQQSLVRAVKSLSKDAVVDLLLRDARERADAERRAAAAAAADDDDHGGGGGDDDDDDASRAVAAAVAAATSAGGGGSADADGSGGADRHRAGAGVKESAVAAYARQRTELRQRPFADLCSSISADDLPQVRPCVGRWGGRRKRTTCRRCGHALGDGWEGGRGRPAIER